MRKSKRSVQPSNSTGESMTADKMGSETIAHMKTEVHEWSNSILSRYDLLSKYVNSLEGMNAKLEARTDRSLILAEVWTHLLREEILTNF